MTTPTSNAMPSLSRDKAAADELASPYLNGPHHCAALGTERCGDCGGTLHSVKPWRLEDVIGKPLGRSRGFSMACQLRPTCVSVERLTALADEGAVSGLITGKAVYWPITFPVPCVLVAGPAGPKAGRGCDTVIPTWGESLCATRYRILAA